MARRLLCPWDSPGKNTGVGCHALLQGVFPTQGWNSHLLHCRQILHCLCHQGSTRHLVDMFAEEIKHTHRSCSPHSLLSSILALLGQAVLCPPARTSPLKPRLENMSHRPNAHVSVMPRESDDLLVRSPEVCSPPSPHLMSKVHCSVQCIYYLLVST